MKKTLIIYGVYGLFVVLLLVMGKMMGLSQKEYAMYVLPIILVLAIFPLSFDDVGSVCLVIAWLPFSRGIAQFELGVITINPYIAGMTALAALAGLKIAFTGVRYQFNRIDLLVILISLIYFLSTVMSDDVISSGYLAFHAIYVPVISYFVCKYYLRSDEDIKKAILFFIVSVTIFSVLAVIQFVVTGQRVAMLGMPFIGVATLTTAGLMLIFGTCDWKKPIWLFAIILVLLGVIVSFSRVYLVIILVAPFMYNYIKKGKGRFFINGILIATLFGTLLVAINPEPFKPSNFDRSLERSFERITSLDFWKGSIYGRAHSYHAGLDRFIESPVIGHGLQRGEVNITTHNFHVEWLEYSGLVGYFLWYFLFYFHFKRMSKFASTDRYVATGLLIIAMVLINSVTNGFMHGVMPTITFILIGLNEAKFLSRKKTDGVADNKVSMSSPVKKILREAKS